MAKLGHYDWDLQSGELSWSEGVFAIYQRDPSEFSPSIRTILPLIHSDDRHRIDSALQRAVANKSWFNVEYRVVLNDGSVRHFQDEGELTYDDIGTAVHLFGVVQDITDRKTTENELQFLGSITRQISDAIVVTDPDFRITYVNDAAQRMSGFVAEDLVGRKPDALNPRPMSEHMNRAVLKTVSAGMTWTGVQECARSDGTEIVCELQISPLRSPHGKVTGYIWIYRDVTGQKQIETALRESEELHRRLVETMSEGLVIRDESGVLVFVNDKFCEMLGYQRDELIGSLPTDFLDDDNAALVSEQMARRARGETAPYELEWLRKDGHRVTTIVSPETIVDATGSQRGAFAVITDITGRKKIESMLRRAREALETERKVLMEKNIALKQILAHIEEEKDDFKAKLYKELQATIRPALTRLAGAQDNDAVADLESLEQELGHMLEENVDPFKSRYSFLTTREAEVCELIEDGLTSKEISDRLNLSLLTVHKHRETIRKKLGLQGKDINLSTYLRSH